MDQTKQLRSGFWPRPAILVTATVSHLSPTTSRQQTHWQKNNIALRLSLLPSLVSVTPVEKSDH